MKLISLNTWGGKLFRPLVSFVESHASSTDIFCLQEMSVSPEPRTDVDESVRDNLVGDIGTLLPNHQEYIAVFQEGFNWAPVTHYVGLANIIFIRKDMPVEGHGEVFIHGSKNGLDFVQALKGDWLTQPRVLQFVQTRDTQGNPLTIFNYHGLWHLSGKGDLPERLEQSDKILAFMQKFEGKKILCGDFNLDMETESVRKLESVLTNLVKEHGIVSTRHPEHYPKLDTMPYADYTFVTPDIVVKSFEVPVVPVSDHLPMILQFE